MRPILDGYKKSLRYDRKLLGSVAWPPAERTPSHPASGPMSDLFLSFIVQPRDVAPHLAGLALTAGNNID